MASRNFSLDEFKKWMNSQDDIVYEIPQSHHVIGTRVESKLNARRLANRISPESGEVDDLVVDFIEMGGTIADVDGKNFLIKTDSGAFFVPRLYVRPA